MQLPTDISSVHIAIPVVLILLGIVYTRADHIFGRRPKSGMNYVVKWGKEKLTFPLPSPDTKLGVIRQQLADYTQLPPQSFKLVHAGAVMKDDNAPISSYQITGKSRIALIGGGENVVPSSKAAPERPTQETTITKIRTELEKVRTTLRPDVESFLDALAAVQPHPTFTATAASPQPASGPSTLTSGPGKQLDLSLEHARLGEMLLQSLLRLDAINAEGEWEEARKERKGAVREVQTLLDKLDGSWRARVKT